MRKLVIGLFVSFIIFSCGSQFEQTEEQRLQDSIKSEQERSSAIENADDFFSSVETNDE